MFVVDKKRKIEGGFASVIPHAELRVQYNSTASDGRAKYITVEIVGDPKLCAWFTLFCIVSKHLFNESSRLRLTY